MTVGELIAVLSGFPQDAPVRARVQWAGDTAYADDGETGAALEGGTVVVGGWMSNCDTSLEISEPEDGDEDSDD